MFSKRGSSCNWLGILVLNVSERDLQFDSHTLYKMSMAHISNVRAEFAIIPWASSSSLPRLVFDQPVYLLYEESDGN